MWCLILFLISVPQLIVSNASTKQHERTFIMIKPDGVQRGLIAPIIKRFEDKGFKLIALKMMLPNRQLMISHYKDLSDKPFFPKLIQYMTSGPVIPMVWEGFNVVKTTRSMLGATDPADAKPGTIRGDLSVDVGRNVIHGSDSVQAVRKEIAMWFSDGEIVEWDSANERWIYE